MKRIISLSIMMLCVLFLSAQTELGPKERWVHIKIKDKEPISFRAGDVDSIYFTAKDTAKVVVVDTLSVDLGLPSKLLWSKKDLSLGGGKFGFTADYKNNCLNYIHEEFGEDWKLATGSDFMELKETCIWEMTDKGFLGTSTKNNEKILLPFTTGSMGLYWTSVDNKKYVYIHFDELSESVEFEERTDNNSQSKAVRAVRMKSDNSGSGEDDPTYTGKYKRPEAVDLGLSVKWGSFNLGAASIADYGGYFGWGDVKDSLTVSSRGGLYASKLTNCGIAGNTDYDIVANELKGHWRLPTANEVQELINKCTRQNVANYEGSGINVCIITGPNGNKIVLPLAGVKNASHPNVPYDLNQYVYMWTDSATSQGNSYHYQINGNVASGSGCARNFHISMRPVYDDSSDTGSGSVTPDPYAGDKTYAIVEGSENNPQTGIIPQQAVDMGTEVKWARWNLGATSRTGANSIGRYYSWGETEEKSSYTANDYILDLPKAGENGFYNLAPDNDAATQLWGSAWRMPTAGELRELINKSTVTWGVQDGVNGLFFTSNETQKSIFFPAGGYKNGTSVVGNGEQARYWTSEVYDFGNDTQKKSWATSTEFYYGQTVDMTKGIWRYYGLLIRPVMK